MTTRLLELSDSDDDIPLLPSRTASNVQRKPYAPPAKMARLEGTTPHLMHSATVGILSESDEEPIFVTEEKPEYLSDETEVYLSSDAASVSPVPVLDDLGGNESDKTEVYSMSDNDDMPLVESTKPSSSHQLPVINSQSDLDDLPDLTPPSSPLYLPNYATTGVPQTADTASSSQELPTSVSPAAKRKYTKIKPPNKSSNTEKEQQKELARLQKEEIKRTRQVERERKALEKTREAAMRKAEREARKAAKPGECHRHMILEVDIRLKNTSLGVFMEAGCLGQGVTHRYVQHPLRNSIRFKRKLQSVMGELPQSGSATETESQVALIVEMEELVDMIYPMLHPGDEAFRDSLTLVEFSNKVRKLFTAKPTLMVLGCEKYFRTSKTQKNRVYRDNVLGTQNNSKKNKEMASLTRLNYEECLVELEMLCDVTVVNHESEEELSKTILRMNKALAEAPFKKEKYAQEQFGGKSSNLKIQPNGDGALQVWQRMLQEFKGSSADFASAIAAEWPSPRMLYERYRRCSSKCEGEALLEDIEIRRGGGVLTTNRRVGKEMSRKIYELFSSRDPTHVIK